MSFDWPWALALLLLVPAAIGFYVLAERRRQARAAAFGNPSLLSGLVSAAPGVRRHLPLLLALLAFAALVVGFARPHATFTSTREDATIVLAFDTSRSMAADDVQPSRLEAARAAVAAFLEDVPESYRVALVSFSTGAQVVVPPTTDRDALLTGLDELRLGSGTAIGAAIEQSLAAARPPTAETEGAEEAEEAEEEPAPAAILLLSDGAQTAGGPDPLEAAQEARRQEVPVSTVALGTGDAVVEVPLPDGLVERVTVPPDRELLGRVAATAGGQSYEAADAEGLTEVYRELGTRLATEPRQEEVTQAFAAAGLVLLLGAGALSTIWFRRAL